MRPFTFINPTMHRHIGHVSVTQQANLKTGTSGSTSRFSDFLWDCGLVS